MQKIPFLKHKLVLLGLAALILFFVLCLPRYWRETASRDWPSTSGTILATNMVHAYEGHGFDGYIPELIYAYKVNGQAYTGTRIDFHTQNHIAPMYVAESWLLKYPPGKVVRVYYDPRDPRITILEPGIKSEQRGLYDIGLGYIVAMSVAFVVVLYDLHLGGVQSKKFRERFFVKLS